MLTKNIADYTNKRIEECTDLELFNAVLNMSADLIKENGYNEGKKKLYYWMIISLRKRDMVELAKKALETAKNTLDEEYYDLLVEQLNGFRKP